MATENIKILRIIDSISNLSNAQIGVEPTVDTDLNFRMWGGKDSAGNATRFLAKDQPAFITSLRLTAAATTGSAGLLRHDTLGDIDGGLITLATLNSLITGSTLDDSSDPRTPLAHDSTHENGGSDEISVLGLSGLLADGQTPLAHASTHENGGADEIDVTGLTGLLGTAQTPATHATSHDVGGADELDWSYDDTFEPTGFTDPDNIDVSYDPTARTITLTGTVKARYKNEVVTALVSGWTSAAHTASPTGTLFLKYDGSAFSWSYTAWGFDQLQIAIVVFTAAGTFLWAQREVHSFMDWRTHRSEHNLNGTYRDSGGDFAGYVLGSTTATERRPTISACQIYDEDLPSLVTAHTSKNNYTLMHFADASGTPILTTGSAEITNLNGVRPQYNEWTGSTWQLSDIANNRYVSVWSIAVPVTSESGSQLRRYIHWTGQTTGSLAGQQALAPRDLDFGLLASLAPEFILIQQTILKRTGGDWEWEETIRLEGTLASSVSSPSGSFLSAVSVDDLTVKGDGTPTNPLVAVDQSPDSLPWAIEYHGTTYAAIGDSNTAGQSSTERSSYTNFLSELSGGINIYNVAVPGDLTSALLAQLDRAIEQSSKYVFVMGGTNDILSAVAQSTIKANLEQAYTSILDANLVPVAISVLPIDTARNTNIVDINDFIKDESSAMFYVDAHAFFIDETTDKIKTHLQVGDNIHLNELGQEYLGQLVQTKINEQLPRYTRRVENVSSLVTTNRITNPNDFSLWSTQTALGTWTTGEDDPEGGTGAMGMVATVTDTEHAVSTSVSGIVDDIATGIWAAPGESEWVRVINETTAKSIVVNVSTGAIGSDSDIDAGFEIIPLNGFCFIMFESTAAATSTVVTIYALRNPYIGDMTFAGHGTNPELYLWQSFQGEDFSHAFNRINEEYADANRINGTEVVQESEFRTNEILVTKIRQQLIQEPTNFDSAYWLQTRVRIETSATEYVPAMFDGDVEVLASEFISSVDTNNHSLRPNNAFILEAKQYTYSMPVEVGDKSWFRMHNATGSQEVFINAVSGEIGSLIGATVEGRSTYISGNWYLLQFSFLGIAGHNSVYIYPAVSGTNTTFLGDDSTIDFYFGKAWMRDGTIDDYYLYSPTFDIGTETLKREALAYRTDNQMQDPHGGEFHMTARATQLSSISQGSTFDLVFDLNGADIWPVLAGETYYTNIELIGVTNDRDPIEGHMDLWTGSILFSRSTLDNLTVLVPTGGTITRVTGSGSILADAVAVTDDGSGNMQLEVTVDTVANANWVGILKGLYITGDRVGSS